NAAHGASRGLQSGRRTSPEGAKELSPGSPRAGNGERRLIRFRLAVRNPFVPRADTPRLRPIPRRRPLGRRAAAAKDPVPAGMVISCPSKPSSTIVGDGSLQPFYIIPYRAKRRGALIPARRNHPMFRRGHRRRTFLILPQHLIQASRSRCVGTREVHLRRDFRTGRLTPVPFVNQPILQV